MAEVHIIGQILKATDYAEPQLFCKWSLQSGSSWKVIEGEVEGQTAVSSNRLQESSEFSHPLDIHLAAAGVHGWPKLHVEVHAVNLLKNSWPVGYGFIHIPAQPGYHKLEVLTWKIAPSGLCDRILEYFGGGGIALSKPDLIFSGVERYKLKTRSSGKIIIELNLIFRNFGKYGVEFQ